MTVHSAGLLLYRSRPGGPQVLLAHPGGPYWRGRDLGAWSIPKGLPAPGEALWTAARREFREETGLEPPEDGFALPPVRTRSGKVIQCWLAAGDLDLSAFRSATFELEWPPRSGRKLQVPEIDRVAYFEEPDALDRIHLGQRPVLEAAFGRLRSDP